MVAVRDTKTPPIPPYLIREHVRPAKAASPDEILDLLDRPTRRDALPEHTRYADTGCEVHSSCLTCPLVRCRYDEPGGVRRLLSEDRDRSIVQLQGQGLAIDSIARRFGISRRTVFRVLARARDQQRMSSG